MFLFPVLVAILIQNQVSDANSHIIRENRYGDFPSITIGNQTWMTQNWDLKTPRSWYFDHDSISSRIFGRLYFYSHAMAAAPPGWHLPALDEWIELFNQLGGADRCVPEMIEGGSSGLDLLFGGNKSANLSPVDIFNFKGDTGFYWTATPEGEQTAYAIRLDRGKISADFMPYRRANGFSVRYVRNQ